MTGPRIVESGPARGRMVADLFGIWSSSTSRREWLWGYLAHVAGVVFMASQARDIRRDGLTSPLTRVSVRVTSYAFRKGQAALVELMGCDDDIQGEGGSDF